MRPAYVRVDLDDNELPNFVISPVPFLCFYGEEVRPTKTEMKAASSYSEMCAILEQDFHIPSTMLPPSKYFKRTAAEKANDEWHLYRTVPQGAGEPIWRTKARQALFETMEAAIWSIGDGTITINEKRCHSLDELEGELESIAEAAGGKKRIKSESYQPDYDVLVKEALARHADLLQYSRLPKSSTRRIG